MFDPFLMKVNENVLISWINEIESVFGSGFVDWIDIRIFVYRIVLEDLETEFWKFLFWDWIFEVLLSNFEI